ncbi:MAG: hypothetical protein AB7U61_11240 [Methylocystis sp.]
MEERLTTHHWAPRGLRPLYLVLSPAKSGKSDTRANVRACGVVLAMALALMAIFNSRDLRSFARDLPGNWLSDQLVLGSDRWHELMLELGPGRLRPAVHDLFQSLHELSW